MTLTSAAGLLALQVVTPVPGLEGLDVRAVEVDRDGVVWFGVRDHGLARLDPEGLAWMGGLPLDGVADLHQDRSGDLWVAGLGGIAVLSGDEWMHFADPAGIGARVVFSIFEPPTAGPIWFATSAGAVQRQGGVWETVTARDGLPHAVVHAVFVEPDGTRWFACRGGLARARGDSIRVMEPGTNFRSVVRASDGTIWFGTSSGFRAWRESRLQRVSEEGVVFLRLATADGSLWAGSSGLGVLHLVDGDWLRVAGPTGLEESEIYDLAADAQGQVWIASSVGAWVLQPVSSDQGAGD